MDKESVVVTHTTALHVLERTVQDIEEKNLHLSTSNTALTKTVEDLGVQLTLLEVEKNGLRGQLEALKLSGDVTSVLDTQKVRTRLYCIYCVVLYCIAHPCFLFHIYPGTLDPKFISITKPIHLIILNSLFH